jgi:phospholipid/cholesterol/gamma-HCH transport system substrate-binding protein
MIKKAPSLGQLAAMVVFALSVFGLLMFLWLAFGGPIPLRPQSYRVKVSFPEAATLVVEADVRMAGVNVGKVKTKELDKGGARTITELELDSAYAPIPKDTKAILRQKTLLGETYVELAQGNKQAGVIKDGGTLPNSRVEPTVEIDEIFTSFDESTRNAFKEWMHELSLAIEGRGEDLNDALGNLQGFAVDGAELMRVLDQQGIAVRRLVRNTGEVFEAINERDGALRQLIVNSNNTFEATASRDEALAETFAIFPTFLRESRATLARLEAFARNTHPLVIDLKGPADDLGPTIRDLGDLAPDLEDLFRDLDALRIVSRTTIPQLEEVVRGLGPLFDQLVPFFQELNPILSYFNFYQARIAGFISNGAANLQGRWNGARVQTQVGIIDGRSFERVELADGRQDYERGNAYLQPNSLTRALRLGTIESFDCSPAGGEQVEPEDAEEVPIPIIQAAMRRPPCFEQPGSLYDGRIFSIPRRGRAPLVDPPDHTAGRTVARDPHPEDPLH